MKRNKLRFLRNIGIAAHIDAGKTTLTERILYFTGKSYRLGETHQGNSQMDTMKQEIEKGITISAAATHTNWQYQNMSFDMNIIDTPGHVDFMIEVERALRVLDGMVALFDAVSGVESQTETIWQQAERHKIPVLAMVNKMDKTGADFMKVVRQIRHQLGANALAIQIPIGSETSFEGLVDLVEYKAIYWNNDGQVLEKQDIPASLLPLVEQHRTILIEELALLDQNILEQYLENPEQLDSERLKSVLRQAVLKRQIVPVLLGAAYKNKGVQPLMDAVCAYLPSPLDIGAVHGKSMDTETVLLRKPNEKAPFSALVFKIVLDDQNRQMSFFRVYSGTLRLGDTLLNTRTGKKERIGRLYQVHANKRQEIQEVVAGDIATSLGLKTVRTGDTLAATNAPIVLESLFVPEPVISIAIEAKQSQQLDKLAMALAKLQLEDPSFRVHTDPLSGQTILKGMGELHLEIILDRLMTDFGIAVNTGQPQVAYREVFTETVQKRYRLKKQKGGSGLYAGIEVRLSPADTDFLQSSAFVNDGQRLQFLNKIVGGKIPKEYIPAVISGFEKVLDQGPLGGYPIQSLKVELLDGDTHSKDSNALAFERCAVETFRAVVEDLKAKLLEPVVEVEVTSPQEYLGNILGGLNRRRAMILAQEQEARHTRISAEVPLAEMLGYISHLRTVSAGRANFSMRFKGYALVPSQLAEQVLVTA